jgi:hypothetical protein
VWYAGSVSTGTVNSVNSQLPDASGNVALKGTDIPMSSSDATTVKAAIDAKPDNLSDLGVTASAAELNILDGLTADTTELNYTDGVTSNIQTQLDAKPDTADLLQMTSKTVATSGWTAETKTSTSGTSYTYYYRFAVTGITANDFVDGSITSGTYTGNWAVESTSGYIYIHMATQPSTTLTFNIYYKVGM